MTLSRSRGCRIHAALMAVLALACGACAPRAPIVAAASDLQFALTDIADRFTQETGERVELVFGSSGTLARQIHDGAPFEVFLSADEAFVANLASAGLTRDEGVLYAIGRIVLFVPAGSPLAVDERLEGLAALVAAGQVSRFAIANPEHAPYGCAAEEALRTRGLWDALQPSLVVGENVSQAAQFATTGNAVGGIIAYSLALAPPMQGRGAYALIPEDDHAPLRQRMVRLTRAGPIAERFYEYLQGPTAREIFERYGFSLPERSGEVRRGPAGFGEVRVRGGSAGSDEVRWSSGRGTLASDLAEPGRTSPDPDLAGPGRTSPDPDLAGPGRTSPDLAGPGPRRTWPDFSGPRRTG